MERNELVTLKWKVIALLRSQNASLAEIEKESVAAAAVFNQVIDFIDGLRTRGLIK